jgi:hypothetical protein
MSDSEVCTGLFSPCSNPVTHHLEDPDDKRNPLPFCDEHWECAMELERALGDDPDFARRFARAIDRIEIPTRYERKPVI